MGTDLFLLEGRAFSWRRICELRREQLEALRKARGKQPALFELREDRRPLTQKTASGRYAEPSLLDGIAFHAAHDIPP
jgi:hypothetical protein